LHFRYWKNLPIVFVFTTIALVILDVVQAVLGLFQMVLARCNFKFGALAQVPTAHNAAADLLSEQPAHMQLQ
jgi:hypothetical protein